MVTRVIDNKSDHVWAWSLFVFALIIIAVVLLYA